MSYPMDRPLPGENDCELPDRGALLPHPVAAPIALPRREAAAAELQIKPVLAVEEAGAAIVAEYQEDFLARAPADVVQRRAERLCRLPLVHAEGERCVVGQR